MRAAYNRAQRIDERRKMMQAWADYLDGLRLGANVCRFGVPHHPNPFRFRAKSGLQVDR